MQVLNDKETLKVEGGGSISSGFGIILTAIGTFILGLIDGITNPQACNRG